MTRMRFATSGSSLSARGPSRARSAPHGLALDAPRHLEAEPGSPPGRRLHPDPSTVELDDALLDGEPEPRPAFLPRARAVGLLEFLEDSLPVRLGDPRSGVGDRYDEGVAVAIGGDPHRADIRELDGVADEVQQHLREPPLVAAARRQVRRDARVERQSLL